jgi:ABC-2 type transport system ATP-binding protein
MSLSAADRVDPGDGRVAVEGLSKRFGAVVAVDDLSFTVEPGRVTGFLGPNGAGKTTTLRMLLGLVSPTKGSATIGGRPYAAIRRPQQLVGALLEASDVHPGRSGRNHLRTIAPPAGADDRRVDELLELVGLTDAGRRRAGGYSLGMRQRLGLAAALLGDPRVLLLDEPSNGLDPEGIRWLRGFLRQLAAEGRTVLVSSHVLSEVQQTVDDVVIIARGRLVTSTTLAALEARSRRTVHVVSPDLPALTAALQSAGMAPRPAPGVPAAMVVDAEPAAVGHAAFAAGVELHELSRAGQSLEDVFLDLTGERAPATAAPPPSGAPTAGAVA